VILRPRGRGQVRECEQIDTGILNGTAFEDFEVHDLIGLKSMIY
jgi:hypothetical protein